MLASFKNYDYYNNINNRVKWMSCLVSLFLGLSWLLILPAHAQPRVNQDFASLHRQVNQDRQFQSCGNVEQLSFHHCKKIIGDTVEKAITASRTQIGKLKDELREQLRMPALFNSVIDATVEAEAPVHIEFDSFASEEGGESMLGLTYELEYGLDEYKIAVDDGWYQQFKIDFMASGQITNINHSSPDDMQHNFVNAKVSFSTALTTRFQGREIDVEHRLLNDSLMLACGRDKKSSACQSTGERSAVGSATGASSLAPLQNPQYIDRDFHRYEIGMDVGYEGNQDTQARQQKVSAFISAQYQHYRRQSAWGIGNMRPSVRIGVDSIHPEENTPRVQLGDDSLFYRVSSEISMSLPLESDSRDPLMFSFNYQYNQEIGASDGIKDASLDSYSMRNYSIISATGVFMNYSSGKMPLDQFENEVVQLGWKTSF